MWMWQSMKPGRIAFPDGIDPLGAGRDLHFGRRSDGLDLVALDEDRPPAAGAAPVPSMRVPPTRAVTGVSFFSCFCWEKEKAENERTRTRRLKSALCFRIRVMRLLPYFFFAVNVPLGWRKTTSMTAPPASVLNSTL